MLEGFDPTKKINVIKTMREITGVGIKEAVDMLQVVPRTIKESLPKAEAEKLKAKLEEAGAKVTLKPV